MAAQSTLSIRMKEVGLVGQRTVNVSNDPLYARIIGELNDDSTPVTNIQQAFGWFQYQDGSVASWTDAAGNLGPIAAQFPIGKQLTQQRSSREWMTEMARQGFFCVFPDRKGQLNATNWLRVSDVTFDDDGGNIIPSSISLEKSDYKRLWNTFNFLYNWDPAAGKYSKRLSIQKPDAAAFPGAFVSTDSVGDSDTPYNSIIAQFEGGVWVAYVSSDETGVAIGDIFSFYGNDIGISVYFAPVDSISGTSYRFVMEQNFSGSAGVTSFVGTWMKQGSATPAWTDYVAGLPGLQGYNAGKPLWEYCHDSYLKTMSIQNAPADLTELSWFVDLGSFYETPQSYDTFAAYAIANLHVRYTTRQRDMYNYAIPMTPATLRRELLELGTVTDYVFTEDAPKQGWMFRVEDDLQSESLKISVMGVPDDLNVDSGNIIETGSATDEVIESGDQTDNIIETGTA